MYELVTYYSQIVDGKMSSKHGTTFLYNVQQQQSDRKIHSAFRTTQLTVDMCKRL
jgi:hypothetical protein